MTCCWATARNWQTELARERQRQRPQGWRRTETPDEHSWRRRNRPPGIGLPEPLRQDSCPSGKTIVRPQGSRLPGNPSPDRPQVERSDKTGCNRRVEPARSCPGHRQADLALAAPALAVRSLTARNPMPHNLSARSLAARNLAARNPAARRRAVHNRRVRIRLVHSPAARNPVGHIPAACNLAARSSAARSFAVRSSAVLAQPDRVRSVRDWFGDSSADWIRAGRRPRFRRRGQQEPQLDSPRARNQTEIRERIQREWRARRGKLASSWREPDLPKAFCE